MTNHNGHTQPTNENPNGWSAPGGFFDWIRGTGLRRTDDRWIAGVCGGVAERTGLDPMLVRGIAIVVALLGGPLFLAYAAGWALLPDTTGSIHVQRMLQGIFDPALIAIGVLVVLTFMPFAQGIWWQGAPGWWGMPGWLEGMLRTGWVIVLVAGIIWLVVAISRRAPRPNPNDPAAPRSHTDYWGASEQAGAAQTASFAAGSSGAAQPTATHDAATHDAAAHDAATQAAGTPSNQGAGAAAGSATAGSAAEPAAEPAAGQASTSHPMGGHTGDSHATTGASATDPYGTNAYGPATGQPGAAGFTGAPAGGPTATPPAGAPGPAWTPSAPGYPTPQQRQAEARAQHEARMREHSRRRAENAARWRERQPGAGYVAISLGLSLVGGALAALAAVTLGWQQSALVFGIAGALGVLAIATIIAGIRGRENGGLGFFSTIAVIALVFVGIVPQGAQFSAFGNTTWRPQQMDASQSQSYVAGLGTATIDLRDLDQASEGGDVDLWLGLGSAEVIIPNDVPMEVHFNGAAATVNTSGDADVDGTPRGLFPSAVVQNDAAETADESDITTVHVRVLFGTADVTVRNAS